MTIPKPGASPLPHKKPPASGIILALLAALAASGPISTDLYLPSLPRLRLLLGASVAEAQLTLSFFLAGFAIGGLLYGPLSDRFGRRPLMFAGMSVYVLGSLACAFAPTIEFLIAARFIQALGGCAGISLSRAMVRDLYGPLGAAKALAIIGAAMAIAPMIGPVLGGTIEAHFGWRANFGVLIFFGLSCLGGIWYLLAETNRHLNPLATRPTAILANYRALLRQPHFRSYTAMITCCYGGLFAFISGSSYVLMDVIGLSPAAYGFCFSIVVVGYILGTLTSIRFGHRLGIERMIGLGAGISSIGGMIMACTAWITPLYGKLGVAAIVLPMMLYTAGVGMMLPNSQAGAIAPFPHMAGTASSLLGFMQMTGAALFGALLGHFYDGTARPMASALALMGSLCLVIWLHRLRHSPPLTDTHP
ncbi:MAG: multidrug effflux MFS transporter [Alphaproteobacteria bacterium]